MSAAARALDSAVAGGAPGLAEGIARVAELLRSLPDDEALIDQALALLAQLRAAVGPHGAAHAVEAVRAAEEMLSASRAGQQMVQVKELDALLRCCAVALSPAATSVAPSPGRLEPRPSHTQESTDRRNTMETKAAPTADEPQGGIQKFLTFQLGGESYGVEIERVQEIKGYSPVTPLPNCPAYVRGVLNLRGVIVPVVDLRRRFGMSDVEYTKRNAIIVLVTQGRLAGLLVDDVSDVLDVPRAELHAPPIGVGSAASFVRGLARVGDGLMIQVDVEKVIAVGEEN